jgi:transglutaminase-like putative cysteine protease
MNFKVSSELCYKVSSFSTLILNIHALRASNQTVLEEKITIDPFIRMEEFTSSNHDNRFVRLEVKKETLFKINYEAVVSTSYILLNQSNAQANVEVGHLDGDVMQYLFPSRYCQSDKLQRLAINQFGKIENLFLKVLAITDWINGNVEYLSGSTTSQTSAYDTITERAGVCRDFAHLGIALCRALCIPARYFTGYAFQLVPQDFHACFEAYIGGNWILFDATRLVPLNGLVKIASGRDAADAAVASIFGDTICTSMFVQCEAIENNFVPFFYDNVNFNGLSYQ